MMQGIVIDINDEQPRTLADLHASNPDGMYWSGPRLS
jgi:hypothetical protein